MLFNYKNNVLFLNVESLTLVEVYLLFLSLSLLNVASINIAVKNRLNDGINNGNQSFWNIL